jgi:hypothetical protein
MYLLFYLSVAFYPNKLSSSIQSSEIFYPICYFLIHSIAIYLFLVTGTNPGFVADTDTPQSIKEKARVFTGHYDEFSDVGPTSSAAVDNEKY